MLPISDHLSATAADECASLPFSYWYHEHQVNIGMHLHVI